MSDEDLMRTLRDGVPTPPHSPGGPPLDQMRADVRRRRMAIVGSTLSVVMIAGAATTGVVLLRPEASDDSVVVGAPVASEPAAPVADPVLCPKVLPPVSGDAGASWVPEPASFAGADSVLAPPSVTVGVVCRYPGEEGWSLRPEDSEPSTSGVEAERPLPAALATQVAADLAAVPAQEAGMCTQIGGPTIPYLVGLRAADGSVSWVRTGVDPNSCTAATNGSFTTAVYLGGAVEALASTGAWKGIGS